MPQLINFHIREILMRLSMSNVPRWWLPCSVVVPGVVGVGVGVPGGRRMLGGAAVGVPGVGGGVGAVTVCSVVGGWRRPAGVGGPPCHRWVPGVRVRVVPRVIRGGPTGVRVPEERYKT